jgi:hypothetical protein
LIAGFFVSEFSAIYEIFVAILTFLYFHLLAMGAAGEITPPEQTREKIDGKK